MSFKSTHTTKSRKEKFPLDIKEQEKIEVTEESFLIAELLENISFRLMRGK